MGKKSFLNYKSFGSGISKASFFSKIFAAVEFIMPLLLGISVGWLGAIFIEYSLSTKSAALQLNMAANIANAQSKIEPKNGLDDFLSANPFSISPLPVAANNVVVQREEYVEVKNSFATSTLIGTFPKAGVWLQDNTNDKLIYISIGDNFDVYKLTEVLYDRAIFQDEEENNVTKFLYLAIDANVTTANVAPPPRASAPQPSSSIIIPAEVNGRGEGIIDRETVNELLMNPFDEMKKFRIRPKFNGSESIGIEVQWLQNDSILGKLGVARNDVIQSINGIPMKNMGDIANAINSLMNGSRFDVEVLRGNNKEMLTYEVR